MVQKSQGQPSGTSKKTCKQWDELPTSTGEFTVFLNHQQLSGVHWSLDTGRPSPWVRSTVEKSSCSNGWYFNALFAYDLYRLPSLKLTFCTRKWTTGKGDCYATPSFLGAMLVSGRVLVEFCRLLTFDILSINQLLYLLIRALVEKPNPHCQPCPVPVLLTSLVPPAPFMVLSSAKRLKVRISWSAAETPKKRHRRNQFLKSPKVSRIFQGYSLLAFA